MSEMIWKPLSHPVIEDGYLISPYGDIIHRDAPESFSYKANHHSTNGYDYAFFMIKKEYRVKNILVRLFPIDEIVASVYIPIPRELEHKRVTVKHLNGNTRDISLENMEWVEDIEEWKDVIYPGIKENLYKISNHGRIVNKVTLIESTGVMKNGNIQSALLDYNNKYTWLAKDKLVALNFIENKDRERNRINHIDGQRANNYYKNLEWVTEKDNYDHSMTGCLNEEVTDKRPRGSYSVLSRPIVENICEIIVRCKGDVKQITDELAQSNIKISRANLLAIMHKQSWTEVSNDYFSDPLYKKLSDDNVIKIARCIAKYKGTPHVAQKVYNELKNEIPNLKISNVSSILYKLSFSRLTDNIF